MLFRLGCGGLGRIDGVMADEYGLKQSGGGISSLSMSAHQAIAALDRVQGRQAGLLQRVCTVFDCLRGGWVTGNGSVCFSEASVDGNRLLA